MTTFYCVRFETPPTWRARFPYLYPPGTGCPGYTPRHCRDVYPLRVGSIGAPSRTVFVRGTNSKQREVPKIPGRNTKANTFQKGSAGFIKIVVITVINSNILLFQE
jgi:hypothetical protein